MHSLLLCCLGPNLIPRTLVGKSLGMRLALALFPNSHTPIFHTTRLGCGSLRPRLGSSQLPQIASVFQLWPASLVYEPYPPVYSTLALLYSYHRSSRTKFWKFPHHNYTIHYWTSLCNPPSPLLRSVFPSSFPPLPPPLPPPLLSSSPSSSPPLLSFSSPFHQGEGLPQVSQRLTPLW